MEKKVNELMENQTHVLEAIKYLNERIEDIIDKKKKDNCNDVKDILDSQAMIDNIIVKNSDDILIIKKTKEENTVAIKRLETKIDKLDKEIEMTNKKILDAEDMPKNSYEKTVNLMACIVCQISFDRHVDLENHIKSSHEKRPVYQCDKCEKSFVLRWRLKKHMNLHTKKNISPCHYFSNNKNCPFEEYGCKFLHVASKKCEFSSSLFVQKKSA